jgi:hypothetical protein
MQGRRRKNQDACGLSFGGYTKYITHSYKYFILTSFCQFNKLFHILIQIIMSHNDKPEFKIDILKLLLDIPSVSQIREKHGIKPASILQEYENIKPIYGCPSLPITKPTLKLKSKPKPDIGPKSSSRKEKFYMKLWSNLLLFLLFILLIIGLIIIFR